MKKLFSLLSLAITSQVVSANNILIDDSFDDVTQGFNQFNYQSYPWELVDYLDEFTAIGGQLKPTEAQFDNFESMGNIMFVRNGAIRQKILTPLIEGETYQVTLGLGRKKHGDFPAYRIGLQSGKKFIELANNHSHGTPGKGTFKTIAVNFTPGKAHADFISGYDDVFVVIEAIGERGNAQLYASDVAIYDGYSNYKSLALDTDNDGMMDEWERNFSLDPSNSKDGHFDYDQDGVNNFDEYVAGTDPWDMTDNLPPYAQEQVESLGQDFEAQNTLLTRMPIEIIGIRLVPMSEHPIDCDPNGEGALYYDSVAKLTMVCNGTEWTAIQGEDLVDDADSDANNELLESIEFDANSNTLNLVEAGQSYSVDLTALSADSDDTNEIQSLSKSGNTVSLSLEGGSFIDEVEDADSDPGNELQTVTLIEDVVSMSHNGGTFSINDADSDSTNELLTDATFTPESGTLTITDAGNNYILDLNSLGDDGDADATNELQTLTVTGNTLSLSNGGGSVSINDEDADPNNEIQTLTQVDSTITLSHGGGSFIDQVNDGDPDATNELQTLSKSGYTVTLSANGGSFIDEVNDADPDATNELQTVNKVGNTVTLSNGGGSFTDEVEDADADATNELQTVSISGTTVTLSNNGGSFSIDDADPSISNELQTLTKSGTTVTLSNGGGSVSIADNDSSTTNEIQSLSKTGNTISLSRNGGSVSIEDGDSDASNEIQTLSANGSTITLSNGGGSVNVNVADGDSDSTNEIQTLSKSGSTVTLSRSGGSFSINDDDSSTSNELISTISFSNSNRQLSINENGNNKTVTLNGMATENYVDNAIASAASSTKTGALYVFNGTGSTKIGRFLDVGSIPGNVLSWLIIPDSGIPTKFIALTGATDLFGSYEMYFSGSNCTGTMYHSIGGFNYHTAYNDGRLYTIDLSSSTSTINYNSTLNPDNTSCTNATGSRNLRPGIETSHPICGDYVCKIIEE